MLLIYSCITERHDGWLLALAAVVCLFSSFTTFSLLTRARTARATARLAWLGAAAVAAGGSIWTTHFVAMLAYTAGVPVGYEVGLTVASIAIAVAVSGLGIVAATVADAPIAGGAIVGSGIAMMHFVGMAALQVAAVRHWDLTYITAAVTIGILGSVCAFSAARRPRFGRLAAAVLLALAICGMHLTGMAAFSLKPDPRFALPDQLMAPDWLAIAVAAVTVLIVGFGLLGALIDEHLTLRSLSEADRLRRHVAELEATKRDLEATGRRLQIALDAAAAGSLAKSRFLATMSHELRTPLNAVIGFAELISGKLYGPLGDPRYEGFARSIMDSGQHLLSLINDVLDISRLDAAELELQETMVDVGVLLGESMRMLERQAESGKIRFAAVVPDDLPPVMADPRRLRQVLLNLLSNAVKFTPEGGSVTMTARHDRNGLTVTVADTGIGIAAEDLPRALELFGQVDGNLNRRYEGTGLGLPLSKRLVELHGGALSIESTLGAGTTVTVTLPPERIRSRAAIAAIAPVSRPDVRSTGT